MSVPCVLVTPKRKLAGQLAVMRNVLHFFSEFLVEGTCGSTVFNDFNASSKYASGNPDSLGEAIKKISDIDSEKDNPSNKSELVRGKILLKQPKNIKCHRRWNLSKVLICKVFFVLHFLFFSQLSNASNPPLDFLCSVMFVNCR